MELVILFITGSSFHVLWDLDVTTIYASYVLNFIMKLINILTIFECIENS